MTARCAQYMSALKIVCKRKISRRLRKNLHITILITIRWWNYFRSIPSNVITAPNSDLGLNVTDGQTDRRTLLWHSYRVLSTECHLPYLDHTVLPATRHKWTHPALTPAMKAGTRFTYPGGIEGWVDLVDLIAPRPGVEPATFRSRVQRWTKGTTKTIHYLPYDGRKVHVTKLN